MGVADIVSSFWVFLYTIFICMCAVPPCEGQIEVDAYITSFESPGTVSVINTESNTLAGAPISVGVFPVGVAVTPDGRFTYITNENTNGTVSGIDAACDVALSTRSDPIEDRLRPEP